MRALGTFTIQHYPVPFRELRFTPVVAHVSAEVGAGRALLVTVEPPGVRRCPAAISRSYYWTHLSIFFSLPHPSEIAGVDLRTGGPFTYRLGAVVVDVAGRPGRSLLCAGVFDSYDTTAPAGEEAAAQTWVTVKPKPR